MIARKKDGQSLLVFESVTRSKSFMKKRLKGIGNKRLTSIILRTFAAPHRVAIFSGSGHLCGAICVDRDGLMSQAGSKTGCDGPLLV